MDLRCLTEDYDALYARWLTNPGALLDRVGYEPYHRLLDLCGGTGAVSLEALRRGAYPCTLVLLDLNPRCPNPRIRQVRADVTKRGVLEQVGEFDIIVCRQAISYLDITPQFVRAIRDALTPGGIFVFNTFRQPRWGFRKYRYGGRRYFEASGYWGKEVFHIQASPGLGVDVTRFHWYTFTDLLALFGPVFDLGVRGHGPQSLHWICKKS